METFQFKKVMDVHEVQAHSDALLDEIARTGQSVLVMKLGKPIVELKPHDRDKQAYDDTPPLPASPSP